MISPTSTERITIWNHSSRGPTSTSFTNAYRHVSRISRGPAWSLHHLQSCLPRHFAFPLLLYRRVSSHDSRQPYILQLITLQLQTLNTISTDNHFVRPSRVPCVHPQQMPVGPVRHRIAGWRKCSGLHLQQQQTCTAFTEMDEWE